MKGQMKRLLTPAFAGISAARHLVWYVSYRINGESSART
jgi:hypothetical protein